jgi:hypothetical protein
MFLLCAPCRYQEGVFEEEGQWGDHEIDGKMSYRAMQPTCSGFGTGRLQQEMRRSGGRRLGRPKSEHGPKHRRRRMCPMLYFFLNTPLFIRSSFILQWFTTLPRFIKL